MDIVDIVKLVVGFLAIWAVWCVFWRTVFVIAGLWRDNPIIVYFLFFLVVLAYVGLREGVRACKRWRKNSN
jgi:hypothetical protein